MKNDLVLWLFSSKVSTRAFASLQVQLLSEFDSGVFRPERFGAYEPLRNVFNPHDMDSAIVGLAAPQGSFLFKRSKPYRISGEIWNRYYPEVSSDSVGALSSQISPPPFFSTVWTMDFAGAMAKRKDGMDQLVSFAQEVFNLSCADFAFLTTLEDLEKKNYLGKIQRCGTDPFIGLPGLYWMNLFSHRYADWLGIDRVAPSIIIQLFSSRGSKILRFGDTAENCRSTDVLEAQEAVARRLGLNKVFDINDIARVLAAPDWASWGRAL